MLPSDVKKAQSLTKWILVVVHKFDESLNVAIY